MKITFNGYIDNPMGKKNGVFSQRNMYKDLYTSKLDKLILREGSKFTYKLYYDSSNDTYYCYIKVPSEVIEKFYYDVVIMFYSDDPVAKGYKDLKRYYVKFYSNDPAFVYTFAHAFIENEIFIEDLKSKMSKKAVKNVAVEKNPNNIVGYVKSLYFAYLIMNKYSLFEKANYKIHGDKFKLKSLTNDIMDASKKIALRQEEQEKLDAKKRRERVKNLSNNQNKDIEVKHTKPTLGVSVVKTVGNTVSTKLTPRVTKKKFKK